MRIPGNFADAPLHKSVFYCYNKPNPRRGCGHGERSAKRGRTMDLASKLVEAAQAQGASNAAVVDVKKFTFRPEFREACAANACGSYGRCWMCPPDVGDIHEMIAEAKQRQQALVFQSIGQLEDSYDFEGMQEAGQAHNTLAQMLAEQVLPLLHNPLLMSAGACHLCERCARIDNVPCRFPDKAIASLEAYGIAVSELAASCGMRYINGENTVTYFGAFLFDMEGEA